MIVLARDVAGDAATTAANKVNPSEEQLSQIDQPASDNTWHESPDFQGMKDKVQSRMPNKNKEEAKGDAQAEAQARANQAEQARQQGGAGAAVGNLKDQAGSNMSEQDKQKAREQRDKVQEKAQNYIKEKMPKERREQTIFRLKKMIVEIQGHEDCE